MYNFLILFIHQRELSLYFATQKLVRKTFVLEHAQMFVEDTSELSFLLPTCSLALRCA